MSEPPKRKNKFSKRRKRMDNPDYVRVKITGRDNISQNYYVKKENLAKYRKDKKEEGKKVQVISGGGEGGGGGAINKKKKLKQNHHQPNQHDPHHQHQILFQYI